MTRGTMLRRHHGTARTGWALLGLVQVALKRENRLKFGPYLALGAVVALIWGGAVVESYRTLLGL